MQDVLFKPPSKWSCPTSFPDLSGAKKIIYDVETKDLGLRIRGPGGVRRDGHIVGYGIGTDDGFRAYYPVRHEGGGNLDARLVARYIKAQMSRPDQEKIMANALYDLEWSRTEGIEVAGLIHDVQISGPLIDEEQDSFSLDNLAKRSGVPPKDEKLLIEACRAFHIEDIKRDLYKLPACYVGPYAEGDLESTWQVYLFHLKQIKEQGLEEVYTLETGLIPLLLEMRFKGFRVDLDRAATVVKELKAKELTLSKQIKEITGLNVDVWSGDDIAKAANKLGLFFPRTENKKKDPLGNPSFKGPWLEVQEAPFYKLVVEQRTVNRLWDVYIQQKIIEENYKGRVHCQFHQLRNGENGTPARFSSSNPNVQQYPNPENSDDAWMVRSIMVPEEGCFWGKLDYSQQEPRISVHFGYKRGFGGADEARQEYIRNPKADFYNIIVSLAGVTRPQAKKIFLGRSYGMGLEKFAREINMDIEAAAEIMGKFDARVPFLKELAEDVAKHAQKRGYLRTLSGRRKHFDLWELTDYKKMRELAKQGVFPMSRGEAEKAWPNAPIKRAHTHKALNNLIQGSAADMGKYAMLHAWRELKLVPHMVVHDEIDDSFESVDRANRVKSIMENACNLSLPVYADLKVGPNWGEVK